MSAAQLAVLWRVIHCIFVQERSRNYGLWGFSAQHNSVVFIWVQIDTELHSYSCSWEELHEDINMLRLPSSICRRALGGGAHRALISGSTPEFWGRVNPTSGSCLPPTSAFHTHLNLHNPVPDLPDFNTSVDIHEHKLARPAKPTQSTTNTELQKKKERVKLKMAKMVSKLSKQNKLNRFKYNFKLQLL